MEQIKSFDEFMNEFTNGKGKLNESKASKLKVGDVIRVDLGDGSFKAEVTGIPDRISDDVIFVKIVDGKVSSKRDDLHIMSVSELDEVLLESINESTESLESIKAKAKKQSKEEGCVVHVNKSGSGYVLDDWFDSEKTVASYENGRSLNESNEMLNSVSDDIITAAISIELKPNLFVHTIHGNGVHVEFGSNVKLETIEKLSKELVKMGRDVKTTRNGEKSELVVNESEGSINESTIKGGWSFSYRYRTSKGPEFAHRAQAYILAKKYGCKIEYEKSGRYWKVNVNAPEGKMFRGSETSLVTSWQTPPTDEFWKIVCHDIESNGPHIVDFD